MKSVISTFFGIGRFPVAPGTAGSFAAAIAGLALHALGGVVLLLLAALLATLAGWWSLRDLRHQQDADPPSVVIDEVAGQLIALLPVSFIAGRLDEPGYAQLLIMWAAAFLLFRLFDIWKPSLIRKADQMGGPTGIMLDDILAGCAAAAILGVAGAITLQMTWTG